MIQVTKTPLQYQGQPVHIFAAQDQNGRIALVLNTSDEETGQFGFTHNNIQVTVNLPDDECQAHQFFCPEYKIPGMVAWLKEQGLATDGCGAVRSGFVAIPRMQMSRKLAAWISDALEAAQKPMRRP